MSATSITFTNFKSTLPTLTAGTYSYNITGLTSTDLGSAGNTGSLGNILANYTPENVYLDLSETSIPSGTTTLYNSFKGTSCLKYAPIIPSTVTSLEQAFYKCTALIEAPSIPEGVTNIKSAFYKCASLETVPLIPSTVVNTESAFYRCLILKKIESWCSTSQDSDSSFTGCNNVSVYMSSSAYSIFTSTYSSAISSGYVIPYITTEMTFAQFKTNYSSLSQGINYIKITDLSSSNIGKSSSNSYIGYYIKKLKTGVYLDLSLSVVPSTVTSLDYAFQSCAKLIAGPDISNCTVTTMRYTYSGCSMLEKVGTLPSTLTEMNYTFSSCSVLESSSITIPEGVTSLQYTFQSCDNFIYPPAIPNSVKKLNGTFFNCANLLSVAETSSNCTDVGDAYYGCVSIKKIANFSKYVTSINNAFSGCTGLEEIDLSDTIITDLGNAFKNCTSLKYVKLPVTLKYLNNSFLGCTSLKYIKFPEFTNSSITMSYCFSGCTSLILAEIPYTIEVVDDSFQNCTSLKYVLWNSKLSTYENTFSGCSGITFVPGSIFTLATLTTYLSSSASSMALSDYTVSNKTKYVYAYDTDDTKASIMEKIELGDSFKFIPTSDGKTELEFGSEESYSNYLETINKSLCFSINNGASADPGTSLYESGSSSYSLFGTHITINNKFKLSTSTKIKICSYNTASCTDMSVSIYKLQGSSLIKVASTGNFNLSATAYTETSVSIESFSEELDSNNDYYLCIEKNKSDELHLIGRTYSTFNEYNKYPYIFFEIPNNGTLNNIYTSDDIYNGIKAVFYAKIYNEEE